MPLAQLQSLSDKSGKSVSEIENKYYPEAKKAAEDMGQGENYAYIYGVLENMLGIEENSKYAHLTKKFIESDETSFDVFLEKCEKGEINIEEEITSSDIPVTPEKAPKVPEEDEVEEKCDKKLKK